MEPRDPNLSKFKANSKGIKAHTANRGCGGPRGTYGSTFIDSERDFFYDEPHTESDDD